MHKILHQRDDIDWLYVTMKKGERGRANIMAGVIQGLEDYKNKSK